MTGSRNRDRMIPRVRLKNNSAKNQRLFSSENRQLNPQVGRADDHRLPVECGDLTGSNSEPARFSHFRGQSRLPCGREGFVAV
ncbi:MAG: hypothetical protein CMJ47_10300 [Planctomyces sp.]|nr:hypothetical protein [Planctomyces sp.]